MAGKQDALTPMQSRRVVAYIPIPLAEELAAAPSIAAAPKSRRRRARRPPMNNGGLPRMVCCLSSGRSTRSCGVAGNLLLVGIGVWPRGAGDASAQMGQG